MHIDERLANSHQQRNNDIEVIVPLCLKTESSWLYLHYEKRGYAIFFKKIFKASKSQGFNAS